MYEPSSIWQRKLCWVVSVHRTQIQTTRQSLNATSREHFQLSEMLKLPPLQYPTLTPALSGICKSLSKDFVPR